MCHVHCTTGTYSKVLRGNSGLKYVLNVVWSDRLGWIGNFEYKGQGRYLRCIYFISFCQNGRKIWNQEEYSIYAKLRFKKENTTRQSACKPDLVAVHLNRPGTEIHKCKIDDDDDVLILFPGHYIEV